MARHKSVSNNQDTNPQASYTFPQLHHEVSSVVSGEIGSTWYNRQAGGNSNKEYSTYVMGKFKCNNNKCPKNAWSSKRVAIRIRGYPNNGYNAVVFNQRCESCNRLGILTLNKTSYVERVSYRIKKLVRIATVDTQVIGYLILRGAQILSSSYAGEKPIDVPEELRSPMSQQSKENFRSHWEEGMDDFLPERWIDEDGKYDPKRFPRLAFSAGPRVCYGMFCKCPHRVEYSVVDAHTPVALQELYITLSLLVLVFKFEAVPDELNTMGGLERVLRVPQKSYIRLSVL
ncbi:hypothetical protein VMCG_06974 [Cytospora schulzeri]|uniref:3CxxC-type domain-containing protein n=1 Tax=Cytospora schulzeri TaxID=448051 RepID=A0A423W3S1_9PEZI|nr:hypothetical protein VMCG_06974 [Valsa malicola]